jgi:hypothetical protein
MDKRKLWIIGGFTLLFWLVSIVVSSINYTNNILPIEIQQCGNICVSLNMSMESYYNGGFGRCICAPNKANYVNDERKIVFLT